MNEAKFINVLKYDISTILTDMGLITVDLL